MKIESNGFVDCTGKWHLKFFDKIKNKIMKIVVVNKTEKVSDEEIDALIEQCNKEGIE